MRCYALLCAIALAAVATGAVAAPLKAPAKKPAAAAAKPAPRPAPWKPVAYPGSASALPPGYKGNDVLRFLDILAAAEKKQQKDEFETTAAFEARTANAGGLIAPIEMQTSYAFPLDVEAQYDADRQVFTIMGAKYGSDCRSPLYGKPGDPVVCKTKTEYYPSKSYLAQNGYGATFKVTKISGRTGGIAVTPSALSHTELFGEKTASGYLIRHTLPMPLEQASRLRGKTIMMLFVGRIAGTTRIDGLGVSGDATSSNPTSISMEGYALPFEPTEAVFYVVETGQILETIALSTFLSPDDATIEALKDPNWARKPSAEDMARYYPGRAQRMEVNGRKPKVAATWPAAGQAIAPGVLVLKVVFDQPMTPNDFAYGPGAGGETLECLKTPRLLNDAKTFVLLCRTLPGKTYAVSLNKDPGAGAVGGGFANLAENRAEPSELSFTTLVGDPVTKLRDAVKAAGLGDIDGPIGGR